MDMPAKSTAIEIYFFRGEGAAAYADRSQETGPRVYKQLFRRETTAVFALAFRGKREVFS